MMKIINKFVSNESGAITVDWVVLTAGVVGLAITVMVTVGNGAVDLSGDVSDQLEAETLVSY